MPDDTPTVEEKNYRKVIVEQHSALNGLIQDLREDLVESSKKSHFWSFNVGHAITVLVLVGGWLWYLSRAENRISNMERGLSEVIELVKKIDEHGTTASQRGIFQESELSKSNERRITTIEKIAADMSPKLERIDVNISWLLKTAENNRK